MSAEKETVINKSSYTKEQILKSKRFANRKDALYVLLEDDKKYTLEEVDKILKDFYKKEVK